MFREFGARTLDEPILHADCIATASKRLTLMLKAMQMAGCTF